MGSILSFSLLSAKKPDACQREAYQIAKKIITKFVSSKQQVLDVGLVLNFDKLTDYEKNVVTIQVKNSDCIPLIEEIISHMGYYCKIDECHYYFRRLPWISFSKIEYQKYRLTL